MVFSSAIFLFIFLPSTLAGYYLIHHKLRNIFLLLASLFFYAWGEPKFVFLMILSIAVNYGYGLLVDRIRENKIFSRSIITLMLLTNLSFFFVFKYLNFTILNLNRFFNLGLAQTDISLPIGISFFTFQIMSYVIDVYRKDAEVQKNPFNLALYVSLFPQLIAGPIVRYKTVSEQINSRKETFDGFCNGVSRFIVGLAKKVIISNSVAVIADYAFNLSDYADLTVSLAWLGIICYTLQIYFDFSGYSDMAIGLASMFGFHLLENFNYPYISRSVSEFWRRWHISLGTWFRDYVYFPMGGSHVKSKMRLIFNLLMVWSLTGIWHGASWNFLAWGLFYFVLLTIEKLTGFPEKIQKKWIRNLYWVPTMLFIMVGWVMFRAPSLSHAIRYLQMMLITTRGRGILYDGFSVFLWKNNLFILGLSILFALPIIPAMNKLADKYLILFRIRSFFRPIGYMMLFILCISYVVNSSYNPFIYFNF